MTSVWRSSTSRPSRASRRARPSCGNSEKNLPEAFLRRCIFYHIPFPDPDRLHDIVNVRLGEGILGDHAFLDDAFALFDGLRGRDAGLVKKPSTGELLAWLRVLEGWLARNDGAGLRDPRLVEPTLAALVKTQEDRDRARPLVERWVEG